MHVLMCVGICEHVGIGKAGGRQPELAQFLAHGGSSVHLLNTAEWSDSDSESMKR